MPVCRKNRRLARAVYQPISFNINKSQSHCVGTKEELIDLCNEAHKYGIKVIMDVVFNHTANNGANQLCPLVDPDFLNDPSCWHDYSQNSSSYNDRYDVTQRCMAGLPDLNTGNKKIQNYVLNYLKDCIDCGADGFRYDAAKQIETPDDYYTYASDFWPTIINGAKDYAKQSRGFELYCYGELLDAVGGAIHHIGNVHKYAREEDRPEKTLFVITTDGMENASRKYTYERLKAMIERQKEKYGWEFIFLGANIDAAKEAARFGIDSDHSANYHADRKGTSVIYEAMSEAVCNVRANRPMSKEWKRSIEADYKKRGK